MRGEDVFRFDDTHREIVFYPSSPEGLKVLSAKQIELFNGDGYLTALPGLEHGEIGALREYLDWLIEEVTSAHDRRNSYSINQYHQVCGALWDLVHMPIFVHYATDILGSEVVCWSTHLFCKLPGDGMEVPLHQDANYWPFTPTKSVTIWLAIDDVDQENSAMQFVPGSHLTGDLEHAELHLDGSIVLNRRVVAHETYDTLVSNELRAGQVSLHTDLLLHGSHANSSSRRRCGIALRYLAAEVRAVPGGESWTHSAVHIGSGDPSGYWPNRPRPVVDEPHKMKRFLGGFDGNI